MSKKVVGLIVTTVIIVVLFIAVFIGNLRLQKKDMVENERTEVTTTENSQQPTSRESNYSKPVTVKEEKQTEVDTTTKTEQVDNTKLVEQAVKQSNEVKSESGNKDTNLTLVPLNSELEKTVYEMNGVVKKVELLSNNNGVQAQYKVDIEIQVGAESFDLDYFTTTNSLNALKEGVNVIVSYQLTTSKEIVIKSISLKN